MLRSLKLSTIVIICSLVTSCGINNIPTYEEQAKAAWSQVLNQYKRRAELIPNLVETVKGFAEQEKDVLTSVIEARAKATQVTLPKDILSNPAAFQSFQKAQDGLSSALSRLLVTVERYPDIKSGQNFLALQSQLEGTENRISVARRDYIEAIRLYNTELKTYPGILWHKFLHSAYEPMVNFSVPEETQQTPSVSF